MVWEKTMKISELLNESHRDYDDNRTGFGNREKREFKHAELQHELGHETNNIAIAINGKTWKVVPCRGTADSKEEKKHLEQMKTWAENKSTSSGKKWTVHLTGAPITETATAGATTSANIGTVISPQVKLGSARGKKSYTGTPGHSGTKAPPQPKVIQPKTAAGTAKNGLDIKANIFGQAKESAVIKRR
jgi:hypothetical protein